MKNAKPTKTKKTFKKALKIGKRKTPEGMKIQKFAASGKGLGA